MSIFCWANFPFQKWYSFFSEKYPMSNPIIAVRGLGYFEDINDELEPPRMIRPLKRKDLEKRLLNALKKPQDKFT